MILLSLPTRKCGLKSGRRAACIPQAQSLPTRKCGLKYPSTPGLSLSNHVTSYTEVWIEIIIVIKSAQAEVVTSYTEVWVEIHSKTEH